MTSNLFTLQTLDRELQAVYMLYVTATSQEDPPAASQTAPGCSPECVDPSRVLVIVRIGDEDDSPPRFDYRLFNACEYSSISAAQSL